MSTPNTHRFLFGKMPQTADQRIWVCFGQIQDWFFHDLHNGCVDLRRTLELWGLGNGMQLTVWLNPDGVLDFNGNPDPDAAEQLFDGTRSRRPPKHGQRPGAEGMRRSTGEQSPGALEGNEGLSALAQESAGRAQDAAGGTGQAVLNTFARLTHVLKSTTVRSLVLIDEFPYLHESFDRRQETADVARNLVRVLQHDWQSIPHNNMVVFLCLDDASMRKFLPDKTFRTCHWQGIDGPRDSEIKAAIERASWRHRFLLKDAAKISKCLERHQNLRLAVNTVIRVAAHRNEITMESVLQLPPINETEIAHVKEELDKLTGLQEVKDKISRLEAKARALRRSLEDGDSSLPDETLHMVFTGAPGTGKTTVSRLVARFFHALGLLRRDEVTEIIASSVMSSNINETRENMQRKVEEARGGVLFIDEAHQFGDKESMGAREAIQALVPMTWNLRNEMIVILAGYALRMPDFFAMDEGLDRRFPSHGRIEFHDYSLEQLWDILERKIRAQGYVLGEAPRPRLRAILQRRKSRASFGNAGGVENLLAEILENHLRSAEPQSRIITLADLPPLVRRDQQMLDHARVELDTLYGMKSVRDRIETLIARLEYDLEEEEHGRGTGALTLHPGNMLFVGPPGTGKTTVGHLIANILHGIGCIERPVYKYVTRGDLIGIHQGTPARGIKTAVEQARDGVLFVDEAYALVGGDQDTFGQEAVNALVAEITKPENAGTVFILAGYSDKIRKFLATNAGLERRFPNVIEFQNFAPEDCMALAQRRLMDFDYQWEEGVLERVRDIASKTIAEKGEQFGNAGWVNPLVDEAVDHMKARVMTAKMPTSDASRRRVSLIDFPQTISEGSTATAAVGSQLSYLAWTPQSGARELRSSMPGGAGTTLEQIGKEIAASSYQIRTSDSGSKRTEGDGSATGFFVTADGLMVTSAHAVHNQGVIGVLCGRNRTARKAYMVCVSDDLDLALIAVDVEGPRPYLPLGESLPIHPLSELITFGNAHVRPGEQGRLVMVRVVRNDLADSRHIETDGAIEPGFSGGPAVDPVQGAVVGIIRGGYGPSATLLVRSEQLCEMLGALGYVFAPRKP